LKRIACIFLLFVFSFNLAGYYPFFEILQLQVKREIRARIKNSVPKNALHAIKLSENEKNMHWYEAGEEFNLHGKMYDIVQTEIRNGETIYHCVDDTEEAKLFAQLDELVNQNLANDNSASGKTARNLLKHFSEVYIPALRFDLLIIPAEKQISYKPYLENALAYLPKKLTPPPQHFS
jgi:hypothetical protein